MLYCVCVIIFVFDVSLDVSHGVDSVGDGNV